MKFLDRITILSFGIGIYALLIAFKNLDENREQNSELKEILDYLENHLEAQDEHLEAQDRILENLTR